MPRNEEQTRQSLKAGLTELDSWLDIGNEGKERAVMTDISRLVDEEHGNSVL